MTGQTVFLNRRMSELIVFYLLGELLMTGETELLTTLQQVVFIVRRMWVVTEDAFTLKHDLMDAHGAFRGHLVVAIVANHLISLKVQQLTMG